MPSRRSNYHNKTLRDLSGTWALSKALSFGIPPALEIQGFSSFARKTFIASPLTLTIHQSNYPSQIIINHSTGTCVPTFTRRWYPPQHLGQWSAWVSDGGRGMGNTRARCRWVRVAEVAEDDVGFLTEGLSVSSEVLEAEVECSEMGWTSRQVWFCEGGRMVRKIVMSGMEGRKAETKLVYEFEG